MRGATSGKWLRVAAAVSAMGALLATASPASGSGFTFTQGDLVIERVGSGGTAALANTGNPIFLDDYTTAGVLVGSVPLPTTSSTGVNAMLESGTASYNGFLTLSGDGHYLVVSGYDPPAGNTTSLTATAAATTPRVAATVDSNGNIDSSTAPADFANLNNYRSATSPDGQTFFLSGNVGTTTAPSNGGLVVAAHGAAASTEVDNYAGSGEVVIYNGLLYVVSRTAGTGFTVASFGPPLPTGAATPTPLPGFPTATNATVKSPNALFLAKLNPSGTANPDTIYVTDDSLGQIQKWSRSAGGTWGETGFVTTPAAAADSALKGLTGTVYGNTVTLYATANGAGANLATLYSATDSTGFGGTVSGTATTLVNLPSAANMAFRGIQLAPTPLPGTPVPEVPWVALLPISAGLLLLGALGLRRRSVPGVAFGR